MTAATSLDPPAGFRHEGFLYTGDDSFLSGTVPFIEQGVSGGESVLVVVTPRKIDMLRTELGQKADAVAFADMDQVGLNPARIIPAWREFVDENSVHRQPIRGIGEPIWPGRTEAELAECHHHEALLNVAFLTAKQFWLFCPYNTKTLGSDVIDRMAANHPFLFDGEKASESAVYDYDLALSQLFHEPLPEPGPGQMELKFSADSLGELRRWVSHRALAAGLEAPRVDDLVLAVHEIATNSVKHGGGHGRLRIWDEEGAIVCDIYDDGHIRHPLAGRELPGRDQDRGRGLWLVNQVCDLVQIRSSPDGTMVRLRQTNRAPSGV
jgi:anti-sigma regulatory factor (Ser/Thr protein kinase)